MQPGPPQLKAGQTVLVSGAFGGVGRSAVFTAQELGARVIAGVRKRQLDLAMSLGSDGVVALDDETAMNNLAPVDVVANAVRGKTAEQLLGKVKPEVSSPRSPACRPTPRTFRRYAR